MRKLSYIQILLLSSAMPLSAEDLYPSYETFTCENPQEKVFLHLDNETFHIGDTIWYAAYVADAQTLRPTDGSRVLYVDLLTEEGVFLTRNRHYISNLGTANGYLSLSDTLYNPGHFEVRAYTAWMTRFNDPSDPFDFNRVRDKAPSSGNAGFMVVQNEVPGIFSHIVPVFMQGSDSLMPLRPMVGKKLPKTYFKDVTALFTPEGGHRIEGAPCRIAFTLRDGDGRRIQPACFLSDGLSSRPVEVDRFGQGMIETDDEYNPKEKLTFEWEGHSYGFDLPKPEKGGVALRCDSIAGGWKVSIHCSKLESPDIDIALLSRGKVCCRMTMPAVKDTVIEVPAENCPAGTAQIIVTDLNGGLLADRLLYRPESRHVSLQAEMTDSSTIRIVDNDGYACPDVAVSVSVRGQGVRPYKARRRGLGDYLLLASDIKGYLPSGIEQSLQSFLMQQQWRRYDWLALTRPEWFAQDSAELQRKPDMEKEITLQGRFRLTDSNKKSRRRTYYLECEVRYDNRLFSDSIIPIRHNGLYEFPMPPVAGTHEVRLRVLEPWDKTPLDSIDRRKLFSKKFPEDHYAIDFTNDFMWPRPRQIDYDEFAVHRHITPPRVTDSLAARPVASYDFVDFTTFCSWSTTMLTSDLWTYMKFASMVRLPSFRSSGLRVTVDGQVNSDGKTSDRFFYNGRRYKTVDFFLDVYDRERYQHPYDHWYVSPKYNVTRNAGFIRPPKGRFYDLPSYFETMYRGYQAAATFGMQNLRLLSGDEPLRGRTIYWNPSLKTDANGEIRLPISVTDTREPVIIEINGWDRQGKTVHRTFLITAPKS